HARRRDAELLRPAAEAAALHEPAGGAHGRAPAALDVSAVLERDFLVRFEPARPCLDGDGGLCGLGLWAAPRDECILRRDPPHLVRPDEERIGRARPAEIVVSSALDDQT